MAKQFAKKFYHSAKWKAARSAYIDRRIMIDGGMCEVCRKRPGYIVHHIKNLTEENIIDPEISLNEENFRFECKACHDREEGHFINDKRTSCIFDEEGQPIPKSE